MFSILGLRPTVKLGSDTSLSAPQFESPQCIRICAMITQKYTLITGMIHKYILKGSELY